jgi:hypothetical protein
MKLPRRKFLHLAAGAAALPAVSHFAWGQAYPTRPARWIVGFPAGGGTDVLQRGRPLGQSNSIDRHSARIAEDRAMLGRADEVIE